MLHAYRYSCTGNDVNGPKYNLVALIADAKSLSSHSAASISALLAVYSSSVSMPNRSTSASSRSLTLTERGGGGGGGNRGRAAGGGTGTLLGGDGGGVGASVEYRPGEGGEYDEMGAARPSFRSVIAITRSLRRVTLSMRTAAKDTTKPMKRNPKTGM